MLDRFVVPVRTITEHHDALRSLFRHSRACVIFARELTGRWLAARGASR
jgi:hypothetical protein